MLTNVVEWATKRPEFRNLDAWRAAAQRARGSPFLRGEVPGQHGKKFTGMSLDFFLKPETQANIANGIYDRKAEKEKDYGTSGPL